MNTHYALLVFAGDFDGDHPDEALRGRAPSVTLLAAGPEAHCWQAVQRWTTAHPLRRDEHTEVVTRDPQVVADQQVRREEYRRRHFPGSTGA